jgi:hypothetical protein
LANYNEPVDEKKNRTLTGSVPQPQITRIFLRIPGFLFEVIKDQSFELRLLAEIQQ